jgi:hypothetical protein
MCTYSYNSYGRNQATSCYFFHRDMELFQMDNTTAFISAALKPGELIYCNPPLVWILVLAPMVFHMRGNFELLLKALVLQQCTGRSPVVFPFGVLDLLVLGVHFGCIIILLMKSFFAFMLMIFYFQLLLYLVQCCLCSLQSVSRLQILQCWNFYWS